MAKRLVYFNELSIIRGFVKKIKPFQVLATQQLFDFSQIYNKSNQYGEKMTTKPRSRKNNQRTPAHYRSSNLRFHYLAHR
jgi:hypothetical protein